MDSSLIGIAADLDFEPRTNKFVVGIANDFEDGKWRFAKFQQFIWDNVAETALSNREREALRSRPFSLLQAAAENLRLTDTDQDISKGSELAEIVLYGIMKHRYKALPVVPKIFYKQNVQDNAKGADSVHITIEDDGDFSLWFGEAKFYNSIEDVRLSSVISSVKNSLATEKLKKENSIITSVSDLDYLDIDDEIRGKIKESLKNKNSIDSIKPKLNIPILLLHECKITEAACELSEQYLNELRAYHTQRATAYFKKQVKALADVYKYSEIKFHLILFPVPKKSPIVDSFVNQVAAQQS